MSYSISNSMESVPSLSDEGVDATENWKNLTKNCKRDRMIKTIALVALTILCAALLAASFAAIFTPFAYLAAFLPLAFGAFVITAYKTHSFLKREKYETEEGAQRIVNAISGGEYWFFNFDDNTCTEKDLVKYGFISKDHLENIKNKVAIIKSCGDPWEGGQDDSHYRNELRQYIQENVVPNLPDPSLVID